MAQTEIKYFTPQEANRTLPLVKQIVRDILNNASQIKIIAESFGGNIENNHDIQRLIVEINSFIKELNDIGCDYKDLNFQVGLVDFPTIIDNEEVLLCWRSDEEDIRFYHGIEEGFTGRKPIPEEYFQNN